ncbi:UNKNOWN [Stylonychia lemnae]|uniref:Uncharacterized protein n=1 Tax=Stylonychia lemnae TaxID=5949 RepID=A0A078AYJ9_STYLE|nr:UNKNOWN [Stylonychia lemnae]|eukprot:CDW86287.1 UNKNOWN [Stylonychia lemnae]
MDQPYDGSNLNLNGKQINQLAVFRSREPSGSNHILNAGSEASNAGNSRYKQSKDVEQIMAKKYQNKKTLAEIQRENILNEYLDDVIHHRNQKQSSLSLPDVNDQKMQQQFQARRKSKIEIVEDKVGIDSLQIEQSGSSERIKLFNKAYQQSHSGYRIHSQTELSNPSTGTTVIDLDQFKTQQSSLKMPALESQRKLSHQEFEPYSLYLESFRKNLDLIAEKQKQLDVAGSQSSNIQGVIHRKNQRIHSKQGAIVVAPKDQLMHQQNSHPVQLVSQETKNFIDNREVSHFYFLPQIQKRQQQIATQQSIKNTLTVNGSQAQQKLQQQLKQQINGFNAQQIASGGGTVAHNNAQARTRNNSSMEIQLKLQDTQTIRNSQQQKIQQIQQIVLDEIKNQLSQKNRMKLKQLISRQIINEGMNDMKHNSNNIQNTNNNRGSLDLIKIKTNVLNQSYDQDAKKLFIQSYAFDPPAQDSVDIRIQRMTMKPKYQNQAQQHSQNVRQQMQSLKQKTQLDQNSDSKKNSIKPSEQSYKSSQVEDYSPQKLNQQQTFAMRQSKIKMIQNNMNQKTAAQQMLTLEATPKLINKVQPDISPLNSFKNSQLSPNMGNKLDIEIYDDRNDNKYEKSPQKSLIGTKSLSQLTRNIDIQQIPSSTFASETMKIKETKKKINKKSQRYGAANAGAGTGLNCGSGSQLNSVISNLNNDILNIL